MTAGVLAVWLASGAPAGGAPMDAASRTAPDVETIGQCPTPEAVSTALKAALGDVKPGPGRPDGGNEARVTDLGNRYEIRVLGQLRQYTDPRRDCGERARIAAVFIALALNPPTFLAAPASPPPAPAPPAATPPAPSPPTAIVTPASAVAPEPAPVRRGALALAFRLDGARSGGSLAVAPGAELRADLGLRTLGLTASGGALAPTESRLSYVTIREQRFPLALAVTARHPLSGWLEGGAALGAALVPFTLRAEGLAAPHPAIRLDAGAHLAVQVALRRPGRSLAAFLELRAELFPRAYGVDVSPLGQIGSTARLWIGTSAGVAFRSGR